MFKKIKTVTFVLITAIIICYAFLVDSFAEEIKIETKTLRSESAKDILINSAINSRDDVQKMSEVNRLSFINYGFKLFYADGLTCFIENGYLHVLNEKIGNYLICVENDIFQNIYITDSKYNKYSLFVGENNISIFKGKQNLYDEVFHGAFLTSYTDIDFFTENNSLISISDTILDFYDNLCEPLYSKSDILECVTDYFISNYDYDYDELAAINAAIEWRPPKPEQVFNLRKGICYDLTALYVGVLRHFKIPVKLIEGYLIYINDFHCWAEAYIENAWIPLDITQGVISKTHDINIHHSNVSAIVRIN